MTPYTWSDSEETVKLRAECVRLAAERDALTERDDVHRKFAVSMKVYATSCRPEYIAEQILSELEVLPWVLEDHSRFVKDTDALMAAIDDKAQVEQRAAEAERQRDLVTEKVQQLADDIEELEALGDAAHAHTLASQRRGKLLERWLNRQPFCSEIEHDALVRETRKEIQS